MSSFDPTVLVLDEMADLSLYEHYRSYVSHPELTRLFDHLILEERKHVAFWQKKIKEYPAGLDGWRSFKVEALALFGRVFGPSGMLLVLEAIEVHGIRKYLDLWKSIPQATMKADIIKILKDELQHEDHLITKVAGRSVRPDAIRNAFLGFNDGSVEILGAVSGFSAAFGNVWHVLMAGFTVAVAGALSMAVGAFMATSAEHEVAALDDLRRQALSIEAEEKAAVDGDSPTRAAVIVGVMYFIGALVPITPFLLGAKTAWPSVIVSGVLILIVSATLAFLSGMRIRRRLLMNGGLIALAVSISTLLGMFLERWN